MFNFSRWQVFKRSDDEMIVCRKCDATYFLEDGSESARIWFRLPKRCPRCGAIMLTDKCWFQPKE